MYPQTVRRSIITEGGYCDMNAYGIIGEGTQSSRAASCMVKHQHHVYAMKVTDHPLKYPGTDLQCTPSMSFPIACTSPCLLPSRWPWLPVEPSNYLWLGRCSFSFACGVVTSISRLPLSRALFVHICCRGGVCIVNHAQGGGSGSSYSWSGFCAARSSCCAVRGL